MTADPATPRVAVMGEEVPATVFTREDRQRYREKVHRCLDVSNGCWRETGSTSTTR